MAIQKYVPTAVYPSIDDGLLGWLKREFEAVSRGNTTEMAYTRQVLEDRIRALENRVNILENP